MIREYIAYKGAAFTIEWYYDSKGASPAFQYYKALNAVERIKLLRLLKRIGDAGEIKDKTKFNYEGDQIYAFKPKPQRFLCFFFTGKKIIMTNAFCKKQQKLLKSDKEKALKYKIDFEKRINHGDYYE
ncbi:MAG: type II toxin-antitoxin system RelE/ParE family toxin [Gammaproteobacteria bacterium]|nr:type II toxin-antitoxin system RelE/ParE family toxin [Gammaproteobacteria bacterium]